MDLQPVFSRSSTTSVNDTAFLNWRMSRGEEILNLMNMADGFLCSAIELAKVCLTDNRDKKADILVFPALANANHGIELYLKAISWTLHKLSGSGRRIEGKHNLKQIFQSVKSQVRSYEGGLSFESFTEEMRELEAYVTELFNRVEATQKDDKMDFARYPINNKYEPHFYVTQVGNIEVDLENFVLRFETIKQKLENVADFLYHNELSRDW